MRTESDLSRLIGAGLLPDDSEVISTHNNLVISSISKKIVARVALVSSIETKEDPGDIRYSHQAAWLASEVASVVRPTSENPIQYGNFVLSIFPLLESVDWASQDASEILRVVNEFGEALPYVSNLLSLRRLDVDKYAQSRLDYVQVNRNNIDERLIESTKIMLEYYIEHYPFKELTDSSAALVHGDLHTGNIVADKCNKLQLIDLDSTAIGPRMYDLASWRVRSDLSDSAPIEKVISKAKQAGLLNEEEYSALIGWKLLSSMTHVLRYEALGDTHRCISSLGSCGIRLAAPGLWKGLGGGI